MPEIRIGGFVGFSSVDYPGAHSAVVFCRGCSWRCRYCHNGHLQQAPGADSPPWEEVFRRLWARRGMLDAVVFSGGEPTLQPGLVEAIQQVRAMGFEVGLHTSGSHPDCLARALPLIRWVGFDLKAPWENYERLTGAVGSGEAAQASLAYLVASGVAYELRTTLHGELLTPEDLSTLADTVHACGTSEWVIQPFRTTGCSDAQLLASARSGLSANQTTALAGVRLHCPKAVIRVRGGEGLGLETRRSA